MSDHKTNGSSQFFSTISMISFWFSGVLLVLYLFHVIYVLSKVPWIKIEFFFCVGAAFCLGISSAVIVGHGIATLIAAGVRIYKRYKNIFMCWILFIVLFLSKCPILLKLFYHLCFGFTFSVFRFCSNVCVRIWCIFEVSNVQYGCDKCRDKNNDRYSSIKYNRRGEIRSEQNSTEI